MRGLIAQSVRRPVAVSMIYLAVVLLAAAAWINLPIEVEIGGDYPRITVTTRYGMAAPEAVQALVTSPIESLAVTIPDVRKVTAQSSRGTSEVVIELEEEANVDLVVFELTDRLSLIREDFPPGTQQPRISRYVPRQFADAQSGPLIQYVLLSPRSLSELRRYALDELQVRFASIDGVGQVDVLGGRDPYLRITVDPEVAELFDVQPALIAQTIMGLRENRPIGQVEVEGTAFTVRVEHSIEDLETLRNLPVGRAGDTLVRVADVAVVEPVHEPAETFVRVDGEQRVVLSINRRPGTDTLTVAEAIRERMERVRAILPPDITVDVLGDRAAELEEELGLLTRRLVIILFLVAFLLIAMLRDLRTPLFLGASLAAALSLTIIALYHFDIPVNLLTLTGLALAFGMLVDNAVVVLENVVRYREAGMAPREAAERGTAEVIVPVLAATLTTVAVFGPFVIFQGRLRDFYLPLALAVTFALGSSFFVAMSLMPAAAGRGWVLSAPRAGREPGRRYKKALGLGLRHPFIVLVLVGLVGYYSWHLFEDVPSGGFRFFQGRDRLRVSITLPPGTEAARVDEQIRPFEAYALSLPDADTERIELTVYGQQNRAGLTVTFPPELETTAYPLLVKDELTAMATRYANVRISVSGFDNDPYYSGGWGGGPSYNSGIHLFGYNYDQLGVIGEEIILLAKRHPRVEDAVVTAGGNSYARSIGTEIVLRIDRQALVPHGVNINQVIGQVNTLLRGDMLNMPLKVGVEEWRLRVKTKGVDSRTLQQVLAAPLLGATGRGLRLGDVMDVEMRDVPGVITREDQRYDRWVRWEYRGSARARTNYEDSIFQSLQLPPGYSAEKGSSAFFLTREEQLQIRIVAYTALIIIFLLLASLYESLVQPLIVLLTVPCAMIGVFLIFYFTGKAFDPSAQIGVVLLSGIVVNNAIILVDHINLRRRQGLGLVEGIVTGAAERVRPILVTSITTIGGLLPLVVVQGSDQTSGSQDMWGNLALSTIGGLTAATILTLSVTPVLYLLAERMRSKMRTMARWTARLWRELPA